MAADKTYVPAAFVDLLADMPAVSAPVEVWDAWLDGTWQRLREAFSTRHGLVALRLADVVHRLQAERRADRQAVAA
jgi:hypothetical protein